MGGTSAARAEQGCDEVRLSLVLSPEATLDDASLAETVTSYNAEHGDGSLSAETSWVLVAEDGTRAETNAGAAGALKQVDLVFRGGDESQDETSVTLPVGVADSLEGDLGAAGSAACFEPFFDAETPVISEEGTVGTRVTGGVRLSCGGLSAALESPCLRLSDARSPEPAARSRSNASDATWTISDFVLDRVFSGTAGFDGDDGPGHDSGSANSVIRSYDYVIYRASYALTTEGDLGSAAQGRMRVRATLPLSSDLMAWDLGSMRWLSDAQVSEDDEGRQVLEGELVLQGGEGQPVAPGVGALNLVAKVRDVSQGQSIDVPVIHFQKLGDDGSGEGEEWTVEKGRPDSIRCENAELVGSAKGRFNAQLRSEGNNRYSITLQIRMENGLKGVALPKLAQKMTITLSSDWHQNIRGIKINEPGERWHGVSGRTDGLGEDEYGANAPYGNKYLGLPESERKTEFNRVYNSGGADLESGWQDDAGSPATYTFGIYALMVDREHIETAAATHNASRASANEPQDYNPDEVYNIGSYLFAVEAPSGYGTNNTNVTIENLSVTDSSGEVCGDCDESDNTVTVTHAASGDVPGTYAFWINYNSAGFYAWAKTAYASADGSEVLIPELGDAPDGLGYALATYAVYPGQSVRPTSCDQFYAADFQTTQFFSRELAPRRITKFQKFDNQVFEVDEELLEALPSEAWVHSSSKLYGSLSIVAKYVTLPGGWQSESQMLDAHLSANTETGYEDGGTALGTGSLTVHDSYEAAKASGDPIVGIVYDIFVDRTTLEAYFADTGSGKENFLFLDTKSVPLKVREDAAVRDGQPITDKEDPRLVGVMTWESTVTCVNMLDQNEPDNGTFRRRSGTSPTTDIWQWTFQEETVTDYQKAVFDPSGQLVKNAVTNSRLNSGYDELPGTGGSSWYVQLYGVDVNKSVAQTEDGSPDGAEKVMFDLDSGQRRVDYALDVQVTGSTDFEKTDTVVITDTVPAGLSPANGDTESTNPSDQWMVAYGGVYQQDGETNGGAGGSWQDAGEDTVESDPATTLAAREMAEGTAIWNRDDLSCSFEAVSNEDGSHTLTWTFENVPVGWRLPVIHYSARLGTPDDPATDLANGDSVENNATVRALEADAEDSSTATVSVVRSERASILKTADVERRAEGDSIGFTIDFVNHLGAEESPLTGLGIADVLPGADDGSWSTTSENPAINMSNAKLTDVMLQGWGFDGGSRIEFCYVTAGNAEYVGGVTPATLRADLASGAIYGFERSDGWQTLDLEFDADGRVTAASAQRVANAVQNQTVYAVGFRSVGDSVVPSGSGLSLHFSYKWTRGDVQREHEACDTLRNTVHLYAESIGQGTQSTAQTVPLPRTAGFSFTKTDGDSERPLAGASFALFRWLGEGEPPATTINPDAPGEGWSREASATSEDGTGLVSFDELEEGRYRLVEVRAPDGYVTPGGQWDITVDPLADEPISIDAVADGSLGNPPAFASAGGSLRLPNYPPPFIPSAGGRGVALFLLAGAALIATGVVLSHGRR